MSEVYYVAPGMHSANVHPGNSGDLVVAVTETGRTYLIFNSDWSCYVHDGKYYSNAQNFLRWLENGCSNVVRPFLHPDDCECEQCVSQFVGCPHFPRDSEMCCYPICMRFMCSR